MTNFIGTYWIDKKLCDDIVKHYHEYPNKEPGTNADGLVHKDIKDSMDVPFRGEVSDRYFEHLRHCVQRYNKKYNYSRVNGKSLIIREDGNIQFYQPKGGYKKYHFELDKCHEIVSKRHLVFMTYLNNVWWGGETQFLYQKKKVKARKGKTLIWPSDWTHTHRGIVAPFESKIIVTGWLSV